MNAERFGVLREPVAPGSSVAYTGTAGSITQAVRGSSVLIWCTTDAWVTAGVAATTDGTPLPAFTPIWLPLPKDSIPGETDIVASAIQVSSGGTLFAQQFN